MSVSTTRIEWSRKLEDSFGMITMSIGSFALHDENE